MIMGAVPKRLIITAKKTRPPPIIQHPGTLALPIVTDDRQTLHIVSYDPMDTIYRARGGYANRPSNGAILTLKLDDKYKDSGKGGCP